jgi:hypothetical protein
MLIGAVVLAVAGVLTFGGFEFRQFYRDLEKYCGIRTAYDRGEVLYRLGFPATVLDDSQKNYKYPGRRSYEANRKAATDDPDKVMPAGKTVSDYFEWSYLLKNPGNNTTANVYVDFDRATKQIENIDCVDFSDNQHLCPPLAGIKVGDSEDRVRDKLGSPDRYELDGVTKTMSYESIGVEFKLTKGTVYYLRLYGNAHGQQSRIRMLIAYLRGLYE